jgi:hypothetical protein
MKINITPPIADVKERRIARECSIGVAHSRLKRELMLEQIKCAESIDDLRDVLSAIVYRSF